MKIVISHLKGELSSMRKQVALYRKWIAERRKSGYKHGVDSYTDSLNQLLKMIPEFSDAIKILKANQL